MYRYKLSEFSKRKNIVMEFPTEAARINYIRNRLKETGKRHPIQIEPGSTIKIRNYRIKIEG